MKQYILALDEGTTSARAILFDAGANVVSMAAHEIPQIYPEPGWVEQDPMEIWACQYAAMTECVAKSGISPDAIAAIGIANQRETTIIWEKETGRPIANAIVWQCRRTAPLCQKLIDDGLAATIEGITGLRPDAYFSATKIVWLLDNIPGARARAGRGELLFGTVDTWLLWKLTGGRVHMTDRSNASRTMLYDIGCDDWSDQMLELFNIPRAMLPAVGSSSGCFGETELMGARIPICGIAGDQQAALFGQGCFAPSDAKNTYGTGCFLLANTGNKRVTGDGLLVTMAATLENEPPAYALEGSVFTGGAVIKWLRDEMRLIDDARDSEYFAKKVADSAGVYVGPAFTGLGAPYWNMNARGMITGLTRGAGRDHIIRAALESIAYQTEDLLDAMSSAAGSMTSLRVDGGASANDLLMQFQADISGLTVVRSRVTEATAAGAAFLAGLAVGYWKNRDELTALLGEGTSFSPNMDASERNRLIEGWRRAVRACCEL